MAKKKSAKTKTPTFEESILQLEKIVANLEGGQIGLAESLDQYEQGVQHLKICYKLLGDAERRIELVRDVDATGKAQTGPFEEGMSSEASPSRQSRRKRPKKADSAQQEVDDPSSLF